MTLGGRTGWQALLASLAALSAGAVIAMGGLVPLFYAIPAIVLALLIFLRLRDARYSFAASAVVCACLFAQPDLAAVLTRLDGPVWLALGLYALATSGTDGLMRMNIRPIVVLGASLSALMLIDPIGVFLVAAIVPLLVVQPQLRSNGVQAVTLAILVLFLPCVTAILLTQFGTSATALPPLPAMLAGLGLHASDIPGAPSPFALLAATAAIVPTLLVPLVQPSLRNASTAFCAMLGLVVILAFAAAAIIGARREAYWLAAALLPITAVVLATWKPAPYREQMAMAAAALALASSWMLRLL